MTENITRRELGRRVGVALPLVGSGCITYDYPSEREITFRGTEVIQAEAGSYSIEVTLLMSATGRSETWRAFHNVTITAYSVDNSVVCSEQIGDLTEPGQQQTVQLNCDGFPHTITVSADETPCDEDTFLSKAVYDGRRDGARVWDVTDQECNTTSDSK